MAINGKSSKSKDLREDLQTGRGAEEPSLNTATLRTLSEKTLAKLKDSVVENMGAFQFLLDREETLLAHIQAYQDILEDCRVIVAAHGHRALVTKLDRALVDTRAMLDARAK